MEILAEYIHGSHDSTDIDTVFIVDELPSLQECKLFCAGMPEVNANLATIKNGEISTVFKGTPDELNNSLLTTYNLHIQEYPLLITHIAERIKCLKYVRALRIILSHLSRSNYRADIKKALKSSVDKRILCLNDIDLSAINFDLLNKNMSSLDIKKVIAFQIGQCMGLLNNQEYYTKADLSNAFSELKPFLYREPNSNIIILDKMLHLVVNEISKQIHGDADIVYSFENGKHIQVDILKETIIKIG